VNDHWHDEYAEEGHRHYDDERELAGVRRDLDHVIADLRELREDLAAALGRIRQLEAEHEADVRRENWELRDAGKDEL